MTLIGDDETLDEIRGVKIIQKRNGYRFSADALLLADFPDLSGVKKVLEIGTGSGIISILMAKRAAHIRITSIELQESLFDLAVRNVELSELSGRVEVIRADIRSLGERLATSSFDLAVSNPPFFVKGKGRRGANMERTVARHEVEMTMADLMEVSGRLLKVGGDLAIIYPPDRIVEAINLMQRNWIGPKRVKEVHTKDVELVLLEGEKGYLGDFKKDEPLLL